LRYVAAYQIEHVPSKYARPPSYLSIARQILQSPDIMQNVSSVMSVIAYDRATVDGHKVRRRRNVEPQKCDGSRMVYRIGVSTSRICGIFGGGGRQYSGLPQ
jgi:hypothetical protein